jgi:hypothetical protein
MDRDLKRLRNTRWNRAFVSSFDSLEGTVHSNATVVLETLLQASDVAHTMQHWHIHRKWNQRLFCEMMKVYHLGLPRPIPHSLGTKVSSFFSIGQEIGRVSRLTCT